MSQEPNQILRPAPPAYPSWLEDWWKKQACQLLKVRDFEETQSVFEKEIQRLSDLFTTGRENRFGDYSRDRQLLLAYGLFYFPQTFVRIQFPLREALFRLGRKANIEGETVDLLDLGSGLGGATLGSALLLREMPSVKQVNALAVDQSSDSLATLRQIAKENASRLQQIDIETRRGDLRTFMHQLAPDRKWDLITASFSLGEAFFEAPDDAVRHWVQQALRRLRPGGLLLITEPALRETSERIERLRNAIAAEKTGTIWAPCPHHQTCPLLATGKYWCHEVRSWPVPESLSFLNRRLFRSVRDLKFSFLLVGPPPSPPSTLPATGSAGQMRLVSPMSEVKGRFIWAGCAGDGGRYEYEMQKREVNRPAKGILENVERGDVIEVTHSQPLGNPAKRRVQSFSDLRIWSQKEARETSGDASGEA